MSKVAIVILSESDTPEGRGRMVHALTAADELTRQGADVQVIFEGIGVTWLTAFDKNDHPFTQNYMPLFERIKGHIEGTCNFCTVKRFEAGDSASALGIALRGDDGHHMSVANLVADGYQIITY